MDLVKYLLTCPSNNSQVVGNAIVGYNFVIKQFMLTMVFLSGIICNIRLTFCLKF